MPTERSVVSVYSGAGGLDIGLKQAGFEIRLGIEKDETARATLTTPGQEIPISRDGDIFATPTAELLREAEARPGELTMIAAGPPCQPFSKAAFWANGSTKRLDDDRAQTLDALLDLIEHATPEVVLIENVGGIAFKEKSEALELINERFRQINKRQGTSYALTVLRLNAADFGVPQTRQRLFIIAHREGRTLTPPHPTHADPTAHDLTALKLAPFATAWDAIGHLADEAWDEDLALSGSYAPDFLQSIPEGHNYLWHTPEGIERWGDNGRRPSDAYWGWRTRYWSFLLKLAKNRPSWTLSASPGPATGPFHWKNRQLATKELQLLQTFPEDYRIAGSSRRDRVRQTGNAVPPAIGELLGLEIRRQLLGEPQVRKSLTLIPERRDDCPPPEPVHPVPTSRDSMKGLHPRHGGTGQGAGAQRRLAT